MTEVDSMFVIPAYAGNLGGVLDFTEMNWMPAFAGMTDSDFRRRPEGFD